MRGYYSNRKYEGLKCRSVLQKSGSIAENLKTNVKRQLFLQSKKIQKVMTYESQKAVHFLLSCDNITEKPVLFKENSKNMN